MITSYCALRLVCEGHAWICRYCGKQSCYSKKVSGMQGSRNLVYPICAPAAVRLDAETGLTPVGDIGQQPYEHVSNPERSGDPDEGSGPMTRHRTTSLSNPLFESVGAVPSHMASHESTSGVETVVEASDSQLTPTVDVPFPEASSPLTGATFFNVELCRLLIFAASLGSVAAVATHTLHSSVVQKQHVAASFNVSASLMRNGAYMFLDVCSACDLDIRDESVLQVVHQATQRLQHIRP